MLIKYASMELGDIVISQTMNDMLSLAEANNLSFRRYINAQQRHYHHRGRFGKA
jgi:hypothetical protein